jgi:hypothetical protein
MAMLDVEVFHLVRRVVVVAVIAGACAGFVVGWLTRGAL